MIIDRPYYEDNTRISNSNIGQFLKYGPLYLRKMLDGQAEGEKGPQFERGTMIHSYLLTPEEFQKDYVVWDKSRPTSAQQEKFCQALANTLEIEPDKAVLSAYKEAYSTAGKSDDKMLSEGLKIASTLKDYIDFLKENDGRIIISPWDAKMLEKIKQNVQSHKLAHKIVWPIGYAMKEGYCTQFRVYAPDDKIFEPENAGYYHEFHINWNYENKIQCKSLLDGLTLDFKNKKAIIYDLKTTQKLWHFEDSIKQYDYLRQLDYYSMAVRWYLVNECGVTVDEIFEWTFKYYIIAIDTTGSYEIRVFNIEQSDVSSRDETIMSALDAIAWHQKSDKWDHSIAYYEGDGSETLNL